MSKINFSKNIYLQAKRTSKVFDISLTKAKDLLACAVYRCHNFDDLISKFESNSLKKAVYGYCQIEPNASDDVKAFFQKNVDTLSCQFSKYLTAPYSHVALIRAIYRIFGFEVQDVVLAVESSFVFNEWKVYPEIKGNKHTVFFKDLMVNDIPYRIIAVSVVTPDLFQNHSAFEVQTLRDELSKYRYAPIMWRDWNDWEDEANNFFNTIGIGSAPHGEAFNKLVQPKNAQQEEFQFQLSNLISSVAKEQVVGEMMPVQIGNYYYYVFGYPISQDSLTESTMNFYLSNDHILNERCVFGLGSGLICFELFEQSAEGSCISDNIEYFAEFSGVFDCLKNVEFQPITIGGKIYEAFFRPCMTIEYERLYSSSLTLKEY